MPSLESQLRPIINRFLRLLRREWGDFRCWLEDTRNFIHLSLLLVVPLLIGLVTFLANAIELLPFLLFPPLVSGAFRLFRDPEARHASPQRFVGGMTLGAICGWIAVTVSTRYWYQVPPDAYQINPGAAAFGILLTGVLTWALDLEGPQAFSTALLVLATGVTQLVYVVSVFLSASFVMVVFLVWRSEIYERRADYLYQTTHADDQVLVPMRGDTAETVATFGARLAAAHETGKIVLFSVVDETATATDGTAIDTDGGTVVRRGSTDEQHLDGLTGSARETAERLETTAAQLREQFDIPCEVVITTGNADSAQLAVRTANETNCDLIVTPYRTVDNELTPFVSSLFNSRLDVVALRTDGSQTHWRRVLLPIKYQGDIAHAMLDFAERLAGDTSYISVCHCIDSEDERRTAESMVADLAETFERAIETRVTTSSLDTFLSANADNYDLTIIGSSTDRTVVSRIIDAPTFKQLEAVDTDVAVVHRG